MDPKTQARAINLVDDLITNLSTMLADDPALPGVIVAVEAVITHLSSEDAEDPPEPHQARDRQGRVIVMYTFRSHAERDRFLLAHKQTTAEEVAARVEERQAQHAARAAAKDHD
jgi:hypothetical protein